VKGAWTGTACAVLALLVGLLAAPRAQAHERSASRSTWRVVGDHVHIEVTVAARDVASGLLGVDPDAGNGSAVREALIQALRASNGPGPCKPDRLSFRALAAAPGSLAWEWNVRCSAVPRRLTVESHLFEREVPHHLHIASIRGQGASADLILTSGERTATVVVGAAEPVSFLRALRLGVEHLAGGADHLVFLLTLVLVSSRLRALVASITGFTIGHSVTLALGALGWVHPRAALVEGLIGISIVVVAVERPWLASTRRGPLAPLAVVGVLLAAAYLGGDPSLSRALFGTALAASAYYALLARAQEPSRLHAAAAAAFGLVHGLGFAGALAAQPLPREQLLLTLLGFNVGIELAQVVVAAVAWTTLRALLRARIVGATWVLDIVSAAACCAGVFWAVTRLG